MGDGRTSRPPGTSSPGGFVAGDSCEIEPPRPFRILVVDDDPISREMMRETLTLAGYDVETAENGVYAWVRLTRGDISLVITDWIMPQMTGLELCRRIRMRPVAEYIHVILVTSRDQVEDVVGGLNAGADEFLRKPVSPAELAARARSVQRVANLQAQLVRKSQRLEAVQRMRKDWIRMVVHDLRSPLTVVEGTCEMMQAFPDRDHTKRLERMAGELRRVQSMLEQMLVLAKSEDGRLVLNREPVDLGALLQQINRRWMEIAEHRGVSLVSGPGRATGDAGPGTVEVDGPLVTRVLENLVTNALKYAPAGSTVGLISEVIDGHVVLAVEDDGPGVPEEDRDRLFRAWETVMAQRPIRGAQHGLGLAFCRMVAEAHGGSVGYVAREPHGSRFEVQLPLPAGPSKEGAAEPEGVVASDS